MAENKIEDYRDIWVIAERSSDGFHSSTFESLAAARGLADKRSSRVWAIILGSGVGDDAGSLFAAGADAVVVADHESLAAAVEETHAAVIARLASEYKPETVLAGGTIWGRSLVPRIAVLLGTGSGSDCTALDVDESTGTLTWTRPVYGGNKIAKVTSGKSRPQFCTIRPRAFEPLPADRAKTGEIVIQTVRADDVSTAKRIVKTVRSEGSELKLSDADFIVSGGRGVKGPEGFALLREFTRVVNGAVGASRAAVDSGWISYLHQVGQTGQTVQTRVYMACGISGQSQHLAGMQSSDFIVAINRDPEAPIMKIADVAIVGDLFEVLPALIERFKKS